MHTILGLNWGHDGSAAIIRDGRLVCAIANERLSRQKKAMGVTKAMVDYVLAEANLTLNEVQAVAFAAYFYAPDNYAKVLQPNGTEVKAHLLHVHGGQTHRECLVEIEGRRIPGIFTNHHLAHCAATYYTSPFDRAACMSVDASGFLPEACSLYMYGEGNKLHYFYCPGIMIGNAYSEITAKLGLGPGLTKAGTLMGLAPYGTPSEIAQARWQQLGGSYYTRNFQDSDHVFIDYIWSQLAEVPRHHVFPKEESDSPRAMNVAASIQHVFERTLVASAHTLFEETKCFNAGALCLGGGSFLNSETNMKIYEESGFKKLHLFPACGDDGTAVGAALYVTHTLLNHPREHYSQRDCMYLGRSYAIADSIRVQGQPYHPAEVAQDLCDGKVVAFFHGRSEFGPRALGARSLLADPRKKEMRDRINKDIKKREWFRPFAPVVLNDNREEWFSIGFESPYMLFIAEVKQPERLGAVAHVDHTARLQTIRREDNPAYHDLIAAFRDKTGIPVLLDTSLNTNNEPLVETPEDALRLFQQSEVEVLVLEDTVLRKDVR